MNHLGKIVDFKNNPETNLMLLGFPFLNLIIHLFMTVLKNFTRLAFAMLLSFTLFACSKKQQKIENEKNEAIGDLSTEAARISDSKYKIPGSDIYDRVFFEYNSDVLSVEAKSVISAQSAFLKSIKSKVTVEGHCDTRGSREYNFALGKKRADAVVKELVKNGLDAKLVKAVSYGKDRPEMEDESEKSHQLNRRSVIVLE